MTGGFHPPRLDAPARCRDTPAAMRWRIVEHGVVDSTSERAFAALAAGEASHGDVHVAREQTLGRGRRGARWVSSPGGLYLSVVLLPSPPAPPAAAITMAGGLAVLEALAELGVRRARLKWPNDVLAGGAKLAGILAETRGLDPERPHCVLGIGVNVAQTGFPPELSAERAVTSLALEGSNASVDEVRGTLLARLDPRLEECAAEREALAREFFAALELCGRGVRAVGPEGAVTGIARALSFARGLELDRDDGRRAAIPLEHVRSLEAR